ncbi:hypothetical protein FVW20_00275 [Desulfovibrio oxamicus]|uniref:Uncharacterized protein n=1 Tax=Nitratidesulfovibrio oxamicus TaxID=32016 RepID=A0ABS0IZ85_9BACT|nr:hypothetical protein [Nitratidesulfovibrio oxamicus]MBG3875500.1 hypothetical protein [Nitratidesulfovibrio oxamicus]
MTATRKQITKAVEALLKAALPTVEGRVYRSRVRHIQSKRLPAIGVYGLKEALDAKDTSPPRYTRDLTLAVEVVANGEGMDDTLNDLADAVEDALVADPTLGGLVQDLEMRGIEISLAEKGDELVGCARVDAGVWYERARQQPELDDFATGGVRWDLAPPDGATDAEDTIHPAQE